MTGQSRTFGVTDPWIKLQRRGFTTDGEIACCIRLDRPGMIQVQIRNVAGQHVGIRQTGTGIFSREAGNAESLCHRFTNRLRAQIGSAGRALALAAIQRHAHAAIPVIFQCFHIPHAGRYRQTGIGTDADFGFTGTEPACFRQCQLDTGLQINLSHRARSGHRIPSILRQKIRLSLPAA